MSKMCMLCGYPMDNSMNIWTTNENKKEFVHVRCQQVWGIGFNAGLKAADGEKK